MIKWEDLNGEGQEEVRKLIRGESYIPKKISLKEYFRKWLKKKK